MLEQFTKTTANRQSTVPYQVSPTLYQATTTLRYTKLDYALVLVKKGGYVLPLCWPVNGECACGRGHTGHDIGKAPLIPHGVNASSNSVEQVKAWWEQNPNANIGIDLDRSGLFVIGPDSEEWHGTFQRRGLPETAVVRSGGGEGHFHYYYGRPADTPLYNINKSGQYDIQPRGYVVAPGSVHESGRTYQWETEFPWRDVEDLPLAPEWAVEEVREKWETRAKPSKKVSISPELARPDLVSSPKIRTTGTGLDRSLEIVKEGHRLGGAGATKAEIVATLRHIDETRGYFKYSRRPDGGAKEYGKIADRALRDRGAAPGQEFTYAEIAGMLGTDIAEPYNHPGADAPRKRFPLTTDRGAIDNIRKRLSPLYQENLVYQGNPEKYERAGKCGWLSARTCTSDACGITQADGNQTKRWCKQRLCPNCLGIQARKPLYDKREELEAERDLTLYIIDLGSYDIRPESFTPSGTARDVIDQVIGWRGKLPALKDCPDSMKTSFAGIRADLHQGFLSPSLVILGPAVPGTVEYLTNFFQQATERDIKVETAPCQTVDEAIHKFGNLMSSMAIYDTAGDCQALMDAFKGRRIVQPRGRFLVANNTEKTGDVSSRTLPSLAAPVVLETSLETSEINQDSIAPKAGGGDGTSYPCYRCGAPTVYAGRIAGDFVLVPRGESSGEPYWELRT